MRSRVVGAAGVVAIVASASNAQSINITIENTLPSGGFSLTPFWLGLHDGSFDVFDAGSAGGAGITTIAELGDTSVLSGVFSGPQTTLLEGNGAPVFSPGETASTTIDVMDSSLYRYFNYAAMLVPTNDAFAGNDDAIELFDAGGNFLGPVVIEIYGRDLWDNGSEVNDITNGAAFVQGLDATLGADEGGVITGLFSDPGAGAYLNSIIGTTTADGGLVTSAFGADDLVARITVTPAPGGLGLIAMGGMVAARRRRA